MTVSVRRIASLTELHALKSDWDYLHRQTIECSVYNSHAWASVWYKRYAPEAKLWALAVHDGANLLALFPLYSWRGTLGHLPVHRLDLVGQNMGLPSPLLIGPTADCLTSLLQYITSQQDVVDIIGLTGMRLDSVLCREIRETLQETKLPFFIRALSVPAISLPARWEDYLKIKGKNLENQFKRACKRAQAHGRLEYHSYRQSSREELEHILATLRLLYQKSWKAKTVSETAQAQHLDFISDMACSLLEKNMLDIALLTFNDRAGAYCIGAVMQDRYDLLDTAYDETFSDCSAGTLVNLMTIRRLCEEGYRWHINADEMPYKYRWATESLRYAEIFIFQPRLYSKLAYFWRFVLLERMGHSKQAVTPLRAEHW